MFQRVKYSFAQREAWWKRRKNMMKYLKNRKILKIAFVEIPSLPFAEKSWWNVQILAKWHQVRSLTHKSLSSDFDNSDNEETSVDSILNFSSSRALEQRYTTIHTIYLHSTLYIYMREWTIRFYRPIGISGITSSSYDYFIMHADRSLWASLVPKYRM